jgi:hypothetical protein
MKPLRIAFLAALITLLASCGGGTGGTGVTSNNPSNAVSIGVMAKGSVIVNGVHFDDNTATIKIDDTPKTSNDLQSGMVVRLRGQINGNATTGTAQVVNVSTEIRGTVQTHDGTTVPPTFTVVGQTVFVDDLTVLANFGASPPPASAVGSLSNGSSFVEVHGLRDATGALHASRVELLNANPLGDELRGTVDGLGATTFTLKNGTTSVPVNFSAVTITLANGEIVEVHGAFNGTTFTATSINIEDDAQFQHQAGEEFEIEGQVSGCLAANPCTLFNVGAQVVQVSASTRFEGGAPTDLADGIRVEAEGHQFSASTLIAEKIAFKRTRVILTGQVTNTTGTLTAGTGHVGTVTVLGQLVQVTTLTEIKTNDSITTLDRVEVRGFVDSSGNVVADRVDDNPGGGNKDIVQAPVTNKAGNVLTLLVGNTSFTADLTGLGVSQLSDENGPVATLAQFLAEVTPAPAPGGTIVKVKGTVSGGTITAVDEAEIED